MKKIIVCLLSMFAWMGGDVRAQAVGEGIYALSGAHSQYGGYSGELEVRAEGDHYRLVRTITYQSLRFEGFYVQEIWTGIGAINGNELSATFTVKQADLFVKVDKLERSKEQFSPLKLSYVLGLNRGNGVLRLPTGTVQDQLTGEVTSIGAQSIWKDQRQAFESYGNSSEKLGKVIERTLLQKIIRDYRNDPFVK